jgi:hypothetical protein
MRHHAELRCATHDDLATCPDSLIVVRPDGTYGLRIHDGGSSAISIAFCPWCGSALPSSEGHA